MRFWQRSLLCVSLAAWLAMLLACGARTPTGSSATPLTTSKTATAHRRQVTRREFGDKWPLTVESGEVECIDDLYYVFHTGGKTYALNGQARQHNKGQPIDPIWRDNPDIPGTKINIGPLIDAAGKLCK